MSQTVISRDVRIEPVSIGSSWIDVTRYIVEVRPYGDVISDYGSDILARLSRADLGRPVPSCPAWSIGDLIFHLGCVQNFWAANLLARDASVKVAPIGESFDVADDQLLTWFAECTTALTSAIGEVGEAPCWTWWGEPRTSLAVARHQVQEVAIHRWDILVALDIDSVIDDDVADDGIGEFLLVHRDELTLPIDSGVSMESTDARRSWGIGATARCGATIRATTSDFVLLLNGRVQLDTLDVEGSRPLVATLLSGVDLQ